VKIYTVRDDGSSHPLAPVRCKNEYQELQKLLECNPDLLPGDQIDPEEPRRWLIIQSEMPVPDPNTGNDRWSVDLLMADQDAIPTLVEVKRFADTRSRREIVGQMFEYAANGHYSWSKDQVREFAEKTALRMGTTLESRVSQLMPSTGDTIDAFFERFQNNLREGQVRLVFFLEDSPIELRSVVDFLNRQMERSEILLVEARQFEHNGQRYVVPSLFGYSEQARQVKRVVTVTTDAQEQRKRLNEESFFVELEQQTDQFVVAAAKKLYAFALTQPVKIRFGGSTLGLVSRQLGTSAFITINTSGKLGLSFGWMHVSPETRRFRERMCQLIVGSVGLSISDDQLQNWPSYPAKLWTGKVDALIDVCQTLISEFAHSPERIVESGRVC
jgi:hypothetical protein